CLDLALHAIGRKACLFQSRSLTNRGASQTPALFRRRTVRQRPRAEAAKAKLRRQQQPSKKRTETFDCSSLTHICTWGASGICWIQKRPSTNGLDDPDTSRRFVYIQ